MRPALAAVLVGAVLAAPGCSAGEPGDVGRRVTSNVAFQQVAQADAADAALVVTASDRFGLEGLAGSEATANLVFSPASAFVALAMIGEGATSAGRRRARHPAGQHRPGT